MKPYLSVIIPAYNEENRITTTLFDIDKYLSEQEYSYEILVVNDGSKDKTAEIIEKLRKVIKKLYLIDRKVNLGKGATVKEGMLKSRGEYKLFMDADNSTNISEI